MIGGHDDKGASAAEPAAAVDSPGGQYSRTQKVLQRFPHKVVYHAYDHEEGIEVAWHEVPHPPVRSDAERARFDSSWAVLRALGKAASEFRERHRDEDSDDDSSDDGDDRTESGARYGSVGGVVGAAACDDTGGAAGGSSSGHAATDASGAASQQAGNTGVGAGTAAAAAGGDGCGVAASASSSTSTSTSPSASASASASAAGSASAAASTPAASASPEYEGGERRLREDELAEQALLAKSANGGGGANAVPSVTVTAATADGASSSTHAAAAAGGAGEGGGAAAPSSPSPLLGAGAGAAQPSLLGTSASIPMARASDRTAVALGSPAATGPVPGAALSKRERVRGWEFRHLEVMLDSWESEDGTMLVYITELTGGSLEAYLETIRLSGTRLHLRVARKWGRQILSAIRFLNCWDPAVVHGSLFSDNLFVNPEQGVLKIGNLESSFLDVPGGGLKPIFLSTKVDGAALQSFSSPEGLDDPSTMSKLVDVYTFGVVFLEIVTGVPPFGECDSLQQQWRMAANGEMPEILSFVADNEVRDFIERCLGPVSTRPSVDELLSEPLMDDTLHLGPARDSAPVPMFDAPMAPGAEDPSAPCGGAGSGSGAAADAAGNDAAPVRPARFEGKSVLVCGCSDYTLGVARALSECGAVVVLAKVRENEGSDEAISALSKEITAGQRQAFTRDVDVVTRDTDADSLFKWATGKCKTIDMVVVDALPTYGLTSSVEAANRQLAFLRICKAAHRHCDHSEARLLVVTSVPASRDIKFLPHMSAHAAVREVTARLAETFTGTNTICASLNDSSHYFSPVDNLVSMACATLAGPAVRGSMINVSTVITPTPARTLRRQA